MSQHPNDPFAFLENSTTRALLGAASATAGPGFLSAALGLAPSAPQLVGEALRKLSIGNTLTDALDAGQREPQDSPPQQSQQSQQSQRPAPVVSQPGTGNEPESTRGFEQRAVVWINSQNDIETLNKNMLRIRERGLLTPALESAFSMRIQDLQIRGGG